MKYYILHVFRTSTLSKEKPSDYFKDLHKLKLITNFPYNMISSPGGRVNQKLNTLFTTPPGNVVKLTLKGLVQLIFKIHLSL